MSRRNAFGKIIPTARWTETERDQSLARLVEMLDGVGDSAHERCWLMTVSMNLHRVLNAEEREMLPGRAKCFVPRDSFGFNEDIPYTLLYERGVDA